MQQRRLYVESCYDKSYTYKISHHTFQMTNTKINSMKLNSITEMNGNCNKDQHKCQVKIIQ